MRLALCRKLHSLRLKDGESAQEHYRVLIELFDDFSVGGETVSEDDAWFSSGKLARILQCVGDCP